MKIVIGAFYSCGRRERRFEARGLRERVRLETLFAASELLKFGQLYISLLLQRHSIARNWCPRVEAGLKMYKCTQSSSFRDKVYPSKLARICVCINAIPWTVPDADTGPVFSSFFFGSWNQQNQNPEKCNTEIGVI